MKLHLRVGPDGKPWGSAPFPKLPGKSDCRLNYGRVESRLRIPDPKVGWKLAWLWWPTSEKWPRDGEIDFPDTVAAFCPALVGGLARLGGLPKGMVSDNDACIVAWRRAGQVRLVDEVAALYGQLGLKPVVLRPAFPQGKGFIERMNQFLETSFLPLRTFTGIDDLKAQMDHWTTAVADRSSGAPDRRGGR